MKKRGFSYYLDSRTLREYQAWPIEKRLQWLYMGNEFRKYYPKKIKEIQDKFRRGEM